MRSLRSYVPRLHPRRFDADPRSLWQSARDKGTGEPVVDLGIELEEAEGPFGEMMAGAEARREARQHARRAVLRSE